MFDFGKHAFFIWASYGTVVVVIGALICWLVSDGRRYSASLKKFEDNRGATEKEQD
ncbi:MAG: heme exporter protein CcmD [Pseudomonadota bacterium]